MCAAQIAKIVCYRPGILFQFALPDWLHFFELKTVTVEAPYLVLIPTILLSAGMLMFFTLGSSMVGDVCDEDELNTGTRSEGSYYSVFWWFIKMGTAFASFVTGALLVFTHFDETQSVTVDALQANVKVIRAEAEAWAAAETSPFPTEKLTTELAHLLVNAEKLERHFRENSPARSDYIHAQTLENEIQSLRDKVVQLQAVSGDSAAAPREIAQQADALSEHLLPLRQQSPATLFRLRFIEIGLPLALSIISIWLTLRYPLTEARCYEIKEALKQRRAELAS